MMPEEEWVLIIGFPAYEVSNYGRVRRITRGPHTHPGRILKGSPNNQGYILVDLWKDFEPFNCKVHKLVVAAFLGECPTGKEVNHKDGDKANNHVNNLEYITRRENILHAQKLGLINHARGEMCPRSKLTMWDIVKILEMSRMGETQERLAERFKVSKGTIYNVQKGLHWRCKNASDSI